jgi:mannose-6-phosphate isomerase-like protein (cupin superfamily)
MSEAGRAATCRVGGGDEVTLAGLFVDYVDHLEHHLRKMLGRWESDSRPPGSAGPEERDVTVRKVNLGERLATFTDQWHPKIVGELNGQQVKLVKFLGPFVWHHHGGEDELFLVVKGRFRMEFRDGHVWLGEGEFLVVPRGVEHRPVAEEEAHVLLFEPASTLNTGNVRNERTVAELDRI